MATLKEIERRRAEREAFHAATPAEQARLLALHVSVPRRPWSTVRPYGPRPKVAASRLPAAETPDPPR